MNMDGEHITEKITTSFQRSLLLPSPGVREDGKVERSWKRGPKNHSKSDLSIDFWGERGGGGGVERR